MRTTLALNGLMSTLQEEKKDPGIINTGSCSFHIIHGALQSGIESPARIDEYMRVVDQILSLYRKSNICL